MERKEEKENLHFLSSKSERPVDTSWWKWLQENALRGSLWERKEHDLIINKIIITH